MLHKDETPSLKLVDGIQCIQCKSKSLEVYEEIKSSNIYKTDENGKVVYVDIQSYSSIDTTGIIRYKCMVCFCTFRKNKVKTLSDTIIDI